MKKIAHCINHTHWDLIWYFTAEDAMVQFSYNMKELLNALESGEVEKFFFDGQTAPIDEYLSLHPEDIDRVKKVVTEKKLLIGPFNSQLDCFISSGESVINNLRLGIQSANKLGGSSMIAYLPDSFGHSYDFPKIFNQMGIENFVITRGVGDEYNLGSEFYQVSNDGSKILVCTMISGYGYGCYAFKDGTILTDKAEDYNKISVHQLIERLLSYSTLENEFVFPLGFDQNPIMLGIKEKIEKYNAESDKYEFKLTTWEDFCNRVREKGKVLKIHKYELFSTQYHRIHKSLFSSRADIKSIQDKCERVLTFEVQPIMSMLDSIGVPYDQGIIDKAWETLVKCQTHSSSTLTDETNDYIKHESLKALNIAKSAKAYLMKIVAVSVEKEEGYPLVIFNSLPYRRDLTIKMVVYTKDPDFEIYDNGEIVEYTLISSVKKNFGVCRKDKEKLEMNKSFYESTIYITIKDLDGISYKTLDVREGVKSFHKLPIITDGVIENSRYRIIKDYRGVQIYDKKLRRTINKAIYLEESGDEGDSYDYSYPDNDLILTNDLSDAEVKSIESDEISTLTLKGNWNVPKDLESRKHGIKDSEMKFSINIKLKKDSDVIEIKGAIDNRAKNHRVRLVYTGYHKNDLSYAGTQYTYITRETDPKALKYWKKDGWFEEPSPTNPILNHVSMVNDEYVTTAFTRSCKEYELIGEGKKDLSITLFRSIGAMGLPDLNRRPGRPSGIDYMIFDSPEGQLIGENKFEIGLAYYESYNSNIIMNDYIFYACDPCYYQNQPYEKTVFPLSYFPTNPLPFKIPQRYHFITLDSSDVSFGTIVKSVKDDGYALRIFNNENFEVDGGIIRSGFNYKKIYKTNLMESELFETSIDLKKFQKGELRTIKFIK